jgi:DtxR family Mn-dependent transcriptional regulator
MQTFCGLTTDGMLDYLAAIYRLSQDEDKVTTGALADAMCVTAPATSSMLKRLRDSGFVDRSSADGITLTHQGRIAALQLIRRHRLLEVFLVQVMGYTWDQVDAEAHRLEHSISPAFELRMDELCGQPTHCPHGDPIPSVDGALTHEELVPMVELQPGQQGLLRRVGNRDASVLRYLSKLSLTPGQTVRLVEAAPFKGPVTVELISDIGYQNGDAKQVVGCELAEQLFILPHE